MPLGNESNFSVVRTLTLAATTLVLFSCSGGNAARDAAKLALPRLEQSAATFVTERQCFSCHHNALSVMTFRMALARGLDVNREVLGAVEDATFRSLTNEGALDDAIQAVSLSDPTPNDSYLLMAADAAGFAPSPVTAVLARRLVRWQRDGHWVTSDFRPPHSSSRFAATASAVRAIRRFGSTGDEAAVESSLAGAREWLARSTPISTEDAAFRLLGLVWADAASSALDAARDDLLAFRQASGGWAQTDAYDAEAYSTGEALVALGVSGMESSNPVWRAGIDFLVETQADDGTWHVPTRMVSPATVSPPYFPTGFGYDRDEFISYAGSAWATMALLSDLPVVSTRDAPAPPGPDSTDTPEPWVEAALFEPSGVLRSLLEAGLDPNVRTAAGTTLLMMAAPDPEKTRMLIERGADVHARALSGNDALTLAAGFYGTGPSVRLLLDAGVEPEPPPGARRGGRPLVFAAMTGDARNVESLLEAGADPSAGAPLAEAITFGHTDVVGLLLRAGADVGLRESSGVNLLHWATITGRADVIGLLADAGVRIDATDENGFTPLMYAATLDFGDTAVVDALLAVGADPTIPNGDGRTPLEQARALGHSELARALSE